MQFGTEKMAPLTKIGMAKNSIERQKFDMAKKKF